MRKAYLGIDIGSVTTKGVIIDENDNIIAKTYLYTNGDFVTSSKKVINKLKNNIDLKKYKIVGVGTTGSGRKLIGKMIGASSVRNEITCNVVATMEKYPNVKTIFEIGGNDAKVIILDKGIVSNYNMNTLEASGIGCFLSKSAKEIGTSISKFGEFALTSNNAAHITTKCIKFTDDNLIYKLKSKYKKEDIALGICEMVVNNYLDNVVKDIKIRNSIVFQGGVSRNIGIVKTLERRTGYKIYVDNNSHLMGAIGVAILSKTEKEISFSFEMNSDVLCK